MPRISTQTVNGWINIYKPRGISSARCVSIVKRAFNGNKIGHTGTLDLEAEGVLPMAIGEATKLVSILMSAKKQYAFTVKFGSKTDTADSSGKITQTTSNIPTEAECHKICAKFVGNIEQIPPAYSSLKVNGRRAYEIARAGGVVHLAKRAITIYNLKCTNYSQEEGSASFICECSKGTYIRTLAEDISFSLQSLGFVIELRRLRVGIFNAKNAINISDYANVELEELTKFLRKKCLKVEEVLDDIPVLEANKEQAQAICFGQICKFDVDQDESLVWVRGDNHIVAIGSLLNKFFKSSRVFNYKNGE